MHSKFFSVNPYSSEPVYEQLKSQIKKAVLWGSIKPGEQLPTIKELATTLSVNPNTIARAFRELIIEGLLVGEPGIGTFIKENSSESLESQRQLHFSKLASSCIREGKIMGLTFNEINLIWKNTIDLLVKGEENV